MDLVLLEFLWASWEELLIQIDGNHRAILDELAKLLRIQLLLNHDMNKLPDYLFDNLGSGLWYAEVVANGFASQFLHKHAHKAVENSGRLQQAAYLLLVLHRLLVDALVDEIEEGKAEVLLHRHEALLIFQHGLLYLRSGLHTHDL